MSASSLPSHIALRGLHGQLTLWALFSLCGPTLVRAEAPEPPEEAQPEAPDQVKEVTQEEIGLKGATYTVAAIHLREPTTKELHFKELADLAYSRGDQRETLKQLRRAYQVRQNPRYLANQGLVLAAFGRYREAVEQLELFIDSKPPLPKLKAAQAEIEILKPEVQISSEPLGAEVMEIGSKRPLGVTPLQVNLISGEHKITLRKEG